MNKNITQTEAQAAKVAMHTFTSAFSQILAVGECPETATSHAHIKDASASLQELRVASEDLPPLAEGSWFLDTHYQSAQRRVTKQADATKERMGALKRVLEESGDSFGLTPLIDEFLAFADLAVAVPALFQRPLDPVFHLDLPEPLHESEPDVFEALLLNSKAIVKL